MAEWWMSWERLLDLLPEGRPLGPPAPGVAGLRYDSRQVRPGDLFFCVRGFTFDGHRFAPEAIERGAAALVVEDPGAVPGGIPAVAVPDTRRAMGIVAAAFYGFPTQRLRLTGVTGTNGKTTTSFLCRSIYRRRGKAGLVGTVWNLVGDEVREVARTTPEAIDLQALFAEMVEAGCWAAAMEVSSHALTLQRVLGCEFDVAVFTNLTQDHLDFHGDLERYREAKGVLFALLGESWGPSPKAGPRGAVVNADDPHAVHVAAKSRVPVLTYAIDRPADLQALSPEVTSEGLRYRLAYGGRTYPAMTRLTGRFNLYNTLAALGAAFVEGFDPEEALAALAEAPAVPGRFEAIPHGGGFAVVIDYAHTPDGLENVLKTARELARGRVIAVFGCGGDRDRGKRPIMGELGARLADHAILTSDNPRSEEPEAILAEVEAGARRVPGASYEVRVDRREAIEAAVDLARPGDVVLIAGKGHETYQIFRDRTIHFDDRAVAEEALRKRGL